MPRTKRDLNSLSRASEFPGEWTREFEKRRERSERVEDAIATRRRKWRGGENKKSAETEGGLRRKPRTGTGNRNEELVPGNFIGAKGQRGETGGKGTGIGCENYSNCDRRKTAAPRRDGFRVTAQTHGILMYIRDSPAKRDYDAPRIFRLEVESTPFGVSRRM